MMSDILHVFAETSTWFIDIVPIPYQSKCAFYFCRQLMRQNDTFPFRVLLIQHRRSMTRTKNMKPKHWRTIMQFLQFFQEPAFIKVACKYNIIRKIALNTDGIGKKIEEFNDFRPGSGNLLNEPLFHRFVMHYKI